MLVIGWNLDADLAALGVCLPAIQCFDLANHPVLRQMVPELRAGNTNREVVGQAEPALHLPEVVLNLSNELVQLRQVGEFELVREAHIDGVFIAAF